MVSAAARKAAAAALLACSKISPADLSYVRTFKRPPHIITCIMDVVMILFSMPLTAVGVQSDPEHPGWPVTSWRLGQKALGQHLVKNIKGFKFSHVTPEMMEHAEVYIRHTDQCVYAVLRRAAASSWCQPLTA